MRRALLIYNPVAGRFPSWLLAERAAGILKRHGWDVLVEKTLDGDHITSLASQAVEQEMEALFVVGGDGSLNRALQPLIGSQTALAHLPAGTANVWAQEIGLPTLAWTRWLALEQSARFLASGRIHDIDVGICNQHPFLLWAGVGLDAFVVHHIEPRTRWEKNYAVIQYAASALRSARKWEGLPLSVHTDGEDIQGHFLLVVISNIHRYAGGIAELSPNALLDDGIMDLWLFEGKSIADTIQRAWDLWSGGHVQSEHVRCIPFRQITLESEVDLFIQLDGEPLVGSRSTTIEVLPRTLKVLMPTRIPQILFSTSLPAPNPEEDR
jgi:diacylglycerol kinase (ATP)